MRGAGLTVGGFYAHFPSKRAMDAEIVRSTLGASLPVPWSVDQYLSAAHRDDPTHGCACPAMLSEVARASEPTRKAMAAAIDARTRELAQRLQATRRATAREQALAILALCMGGLALARAMRGHAMSDEILSACRKSGAASRRTARRARSSS